MLTITIKTSGSAFEDGNGGGYEAARLLRDLADRMERDGLPREDDTRGFRIIDTNGNTVGAATTTE